MTMATAQRQTGKIGSRQDGESRGLSREERKRLLLLGLPTFGMALSITAVSTYLPVIAREFEASTTAIGLIIGAEGVMALWLPLVIGDWSDRLRTSIGGRLPFVLAGTPVMIACLLVVGTVGSALAMGLVVAVFFAGYFIAYEPYRALYPDLLASEVAGRSQSAQAVWRGLGTGLALISGGALLSVADFLPFAVYAALLGLSVGAFVWLLLRRGLRDLGGGFDRDGRSDEKVAVRRTFGFVLSLISKHPALRSYVIANALWELSLGAIKTFVVLYVTAGLGFSLGEASLVIGGVAVIILAGALVSGKLADRYGRLQVTSAALWMYGIPLLVPGFFTLPALLIASIPFVALGGGMLMSLPYSLLMPLMPRAEHGVLTGLYSLSRGVGVMLGPLIAGLAIQFARPLLSSTDGYAACWLVAGGAILLSILPMRSMRRHREDRRRLRVEAGGAAVAE
jgi:MFS family permease